MLNITGHDEHFTEIERYIRTVKERVRAIVNTLTFKNYPRLLIVETVYNVQCLILAKLFSTQKWRSRSTQPRKIVTGSHIDYTKHF